MCNRKFQLSRQGESTQYLSTIGGNCGVLCYNLSGPMESGFVKKTGQVGSFVVLCPSPICFKGGNRLKAQSGGHNTLPKEDEDEEACSSGHESVT
jgi:hypothetical protein